MPIVADIDKTKTVIQAAGAITALLLPPAALHSLASLPSSVERMSLILGGVASLIVVLLVMILGRHIRIIRAVRLAILVGLLFVSGATISVIYESVANDHVVELKTTDLEGTIIASERILLPLNPSEELSLNLTRYSSIGRALTGPRRTIIRNLINREDGPITALVTLLIICAQTLLVTAVVVAAWWLASQRDSRKKV